MTEIRSQRSDDRVQITDAGNQMARIVHSSNPLDLPASFLERCLTLCAMPFALCPFYPYLATPNSQRVTRNSQPATLNRST